MQVGTPSAAAPTPQIEVSPDNPCPFLRALVAGGFVDGHIVPLETLCHEVEAATGKKGFKKWLAGVKTFPIALVANGFNHLWKSCRSGAVLDELRNGPLDKHGVGSRILDATAHVDEAEIERLAGFGKDREDPSGGRMERGLTAPEIKAFMDENFARGKAKRRWYDRLLMTGEWPVLLDIMGKGDGDQRYLSVAEVRTLFVDRRLPNRIVERLASQPAPAPAPGGRCARILKGSVAVVASVVAVFVWIVEFPDQAGSILPTFIAQFLPPPLPEPAPIKEARWLDQNWSTEDRHWFHHASQGTRTFPVPYAWFIALEQPGIHLFTRPGLLRDTDYLERFGFMPSPKSIHTDEATLRRFGYVNSPDAKTEPAPESVAGLRPTPAENFDGLPVGFARLTGPRDPTTGEPQPDMIGLTCAACHTGHINYKGVSVRFDGGPGMVNLSKLEIATGLSIAYTLKLPFRFKRFAARVLGPDATPAQRDELKRGLTKAGEFVLGEHDALKNTLKAKSQKDTEEGYGRLDALNRIGNQVFYTDMALSGLTGFEKNLEARNAPVSFPPIWTVPWFLWAQYDASIEQPLIRNAGEALGVSALVNFSPDTAKEALFRSSVAVENLVRIEAMLRGPDPSSEHPAFGGLQPPKWPSQIFDKDPAWQIDPVRVSKGRALYADICVECHLGPVNDPVFDAQFPEKSVWKTEHWDAKGPWLTPVQRPVSDMGTDPAQAKVLGERKVALPGFLDFQPARDLGKVWECKAEDMPKPSSYSSTEMPYSIALMTAVDLVSRKWMDDNIPESNKKARDALWGFRKNCPNPEKDLHYRARPLNGVWATAPYLHNGSVPSLWWMLMPAAERPKQFCMGFRDFDPEQVGFRVEAHEAPKCKAGETLFLATPPGSPVDGNSNLGHSLEAPPGEGEHEHKKGVIGRLLSDEERKDLIEYLKTL